MAPAPWTADRLVEEVTLLGSRGLSREDYLSELVPRLERAIDNDGTCWHTLDPHTRLMTSDRPDDLVERGVFTPDIGLRGGRAHGAQRVPRG